MGLDPAWEPREVKRRVGYLPDAVGFYGGMTGRQNLRYTAKLNGLRKSEAEPAIDEVLVQVGLADRARRRGRDLLARHAPAAGHRRCTRQVARSAHPRRTDDVDRPARRGRDPRPAAAADRRAGDRRSFCRATSSTRSSRSATGSASSRRAALSASARSKSSPGRSATGPRSSKSSSSSRRMPTSSVPGRRCVACARSNRSSRRRIPPAPGASTCDQPARRGAFARTSCSRRWNRACG